MCRRTTCQYALSINELVLRCGFYPMLYNLPNDCRVPEILNDMDNHSEEIIELTEEVIA